jgi:hypothetical protein
MELFDRHQRIGISSLADGQIFFAGDLSGRGDLSYSLILGRIQEFRAYGDETATGAGGLFL